MNREELYIIVDGHRRKLDIPSPSGITLKWTSNLFGDLSKLKSSYSYTFKLPMTANNRKALEMAEDIRSNSPFYRKKVEAEFLINGVNLCPNAYLYLNEIGTQYSCVMTWKELTAFETMKSAGEKLTDLPSLGIVEWSKDLDYGMAEANTLPLIYPSYVAGNSSKFPAPCVPVYKLIQSINSRYGTSFEVGKAVTSNMSLIGKSHNNAQAQGERVYDDYVTYGALPLVNFVDNAGSYEANMITQVSSYTTYYASKTVKQTAVMAYVYSKEYPNNMLHYSYSAEYVSRANASAAEGFNGQRVAPTLELIDIAKLNEFASTKYVKPLYGFMVESGLTLYKHIKKEIPTARRDYEKGLEIDFVPVEYNVRERVSLLLSTDKSDRGRALQVTRKVDGSDDLAQEIASQYILPEMQEPGTELGVIGFMAVNDVVVRGKATVLISDEAVRSGRIKIGNYFGISIVKATYNTEEVDDVHYPIQNTYESVVSGDSDKDAGFKSLTAAPKQTIDGYVYEFDFGVNFPARKIELSANTDSVGYLFLPYDYATFTKENEDKTWVTTLQDGDVTFQSLSIHSILPVTSSGDTEEGNMLLNITQSLPSVSCVDFMKSVFYLNGAMPRVERDGTTISAMYYDQLRDRVTDGDVLDWSDKLLSASDEQPASIKTHYTTFARKTYLTMAKDYHNTTIEERNEELDVYNDGYLVLKSSDATLKDETTPFTSVFYPPYKQNVRDPYVDVGGTLKLWESDGSLVQNAKPIYGYVYGDSQARLGVVSFDSSKQFKYLQTIIDNYMLIKESFLLDEFDLRDFDESMPVYLSKYNSYFAVSTLQRSQNGICTAELVKLPYEAGQRYEVKEKEPDTPAVVPSTPDTHVVSEDAVDAYNLSIPFTIDNTKYTISVQSVADFEIDASVSVDGDMIRYAYKKDGEDVELTATASIGVPTSDGILPTYIVPTADYLTALANDGIEQYCYYVVIPSGDEATVSYKVTEEKDGNARTINQTVPAVLTIDGEYVSDGDEVSFDINNADERYKVFNVAFDIYNSAGSVVRKVNAKTYLFKNEVISELLK